MNCNNAQRERKKNSISTFQLNHMQTAAAAECLTATVSSTVGKLLLE